MAEFRSSYSDKFGQAARTGGFLLHINFLFFLILAFFPLFLTPFLPDQTFLDFGVLEVYECANVAQNSRWTDFEDLELQKVRSGGVTSLSF